MIEYCNALEQEYDINNLDIFPYPKRMKLLTGFMEQLVNSDETLPITSQNKAEINRLLGQVRQYVDGQLLDNQLKAERIHCWELHDKSSGFTKDIYRVIVVLLYDEQSLLHDKNNQFTDFEIFEELLYDCGAHYPKQFYEYFHTAI